MGFPTYGESPFERAGIRTSVPLLSAFVALCAAECVAGGLLWRGRRSGAILTLALLPVESVFWAGFALPIPPVFRRGDRICAAEPAGLAAFDPLKWASARVPMIGHERDVLAGRNYSYITYSGRGLSASTSSTHQPAMVATVLGEEELESGVHEVRVVCSTCR
jgi:hypothetical protein